MSDKEKIRAEVERLQNELIQERRKGYGSDVDDACILELQNVLTYIDSLQEESVSIDFEQKLYKTFGQIKDFTLGVAIAKRFYDMGRKYNEPVSEELEEAASRYAKEEYSRKSPATLPDRCRGCYAPLMYAFKAGAQWQKKQTMAKAIDGKVIANGMGNPILHLWDKGRHLIDKKVKVIIIKED